MLRNEHHHRDPSRQLDSCCNVFLLIFSILIDVAALVFFSYIVGVAGYVAAMALPAHIVTTLL
jgi:hypothetical protein